MNKRICNKCGKTKTASTKDFLQVKRGDVIYLSRHCRSCHNNDRRSKYVSKQEQRLRDEINETI